jgi:hypothetical protein
MMISSILGTNIRRRPILLTCFIPINLQSIIGVGENWGREAMSIGIGSLGDKQQRGNSAWVKVSIQISILYLKRHKLSIHFRPHITPTMYYFDDEEGSKIVLISGQTSLLILIIKNSTNIQYIFAIFPYLA